MILKDRRNLIVQSAQGMGEKDVTLLYDDQRRLFGIKFDKSSHPDLRQAAFLAREPDLIAAKKAAPNPMQTTLLVELPQGSGRKEIILKYNPAQKVFVIKFLKSLHAELAQSLFGIRESDLIEVKKFGLASLSI